LWEARVARRGRAARLRALAASWSAAGVVLAGACACAVTAAALAGAVRSVPAALFYLGGCAVTLAVLVIVEALAAAFSRRVALDAARRQARRMSVRTLMRSAPHSRSPV
jgi:hypothetical protein